MSPTDEFDPPSHAEDVKRGFGTALGNAEAGEEVDVAVSENNAQDIFLDKLADALSKEMTFMTAEQSEWRKAAGGVLGKLGGSVTSGEGGVVIVTIP